MPFEVALAGLAERSRHYRRQAYELRVQAKVAEADLRAMRITRSRITRRLDGLWKSAERAHDGSVSARYQNSSGRVRACNNRYDLINRIIEELSDTLLGLNDKINDVEMTWEILQSRAKAAKKMAERFAYQLARFAQDRKYHVAKLAGVPGSQLRAGAFEVRISSRYRNKLDVYYNALGQEPLGEGHGHIVLGFDCTVRAHRPPQERTVRRTRVPLPGPGLFPKMAQMRQEESVPLAA